MVAILGDAKKSLKEDIVCEFIPKVAKSAATKPNNITFTVIIITGALSYSSSTILDEGKGK